jgi:molecular chaperone GrpE (heat shock protein)
MEQARRARQDLLQRVEELRAQLEAAKAELDLLRRRVARE